MKNETQISAEAIKFIKSNKKELCEKFAGNKICLSVTNPISIFMAGSPGAGKTEFSKHLITDIEINAVRIDADEIRSFIPEYNGKNSDEVQGASALGVQKLFDYVIEHKKSFILDGTFANFDVSCKNIERSLNKGRPTQIFYIYQEPKVAWEFTKAREAMEGRRVPVETFVDAFFKAKENVELIKERFGANIKIFLVEKNFSNRIERIHIDIDKIDKYIQINYNKETLLSIL
jgi:predicted ABC-type ATPase